MSNYKIGGGNKMQPYVPAGNGERSGEYTGQSHIVDNQLPNFLIENEIGKYNFCNSKLVGRVDGCFPSYEGKSIPSKFKSNSVIKKIVNDFVVTERYYNEDGEAYLDIDYTCHGKPVAHPAVPHIHRWTKDEHGHLTRAKWEDFK